MFVPGYGGKSEGVGAVRAKLELCLYCSLDGGPYKAFDTLGLRTISFKVTYYKAGSSLLGRLSSWQEGSTVCSQLRCVGFSAVWLL